MNRRVLPLIIGSLLLLLGCGGNGTGPPTVVSIAVEGPPGAVTSVGESAPFFATASLSDGTSQDVTADAQWTSSDPSVVTVSATGAGEAVGVGQSEICATYQGVSGCVLVTVTAPVACTPGTDLVLGETVTGDISPSDCLMDFGFPADSFGINITEETAISIHLKSPDFAPFLILRDANGIDIAIGFDEMLDGNARIRETLSPGSYALFAATFSFPGQGSYSLTVSEIVCAALQPIDFGQTVNGTLDADDCLRPGGAFQESWQLVLANDMTARIDLESAAFDAFLVLKDSNGDTLATNDDGGAGLNARIDRALTAGTYEIVASSFSAGQTGTYQLTVDVPPPATTAAVGTDRTRAPGPKLRPASDSGTEQLRRLRIEYQARRTEALPGFLRASAKDQRGSER